MSVGLPHDRAGELLATASAVASERFSSASNPAGRRRPRPALRGLAAAAALIAVAGIAWSFGRSSAADPQGSIQTLLTLPQNAAPEPASSAVKALAPIPGTETTVPAPPPATVLVPSTTTVAPATTVLVPSVQETTLPVIETTVVEATTTMPPETTVPLPDGPIERFTFEIEDDGRAYMRGALPSTDTAILIAAVGSAVVGADNVVAEYVVDPRVELDTAEADEGFVTQTLLYAPGVSALQPEHAFPLDQVAQLLIASPQLVAFVEGYTDSDGDETENLSLSRSRARGAADYLVRQGVNRAQLIETVGKGEADPHGDNATPDGRALNRRVDIHLAVAA